MEKQQRTSDIIAGESYRPIKRAGSELCEAINSVESQEVFCSLYSCEIVPYHRRRRIQFHTFDDGTRSPFCSLLRAFLLSSALRFLLTPSRYQQFTAINQRGHGTNKTIAVWLLSTRAQGSEKLSNPRRCSSNTITRIDNEKIHPALLPN